MKHKIDTPRHLGIGKAYFTSDGQGFKLRRKHLFSGVTESPTTFIKTIIVRTWMSP